MTSSWFTQVAPPVICQGRQYSGTAWNDSVQLTCRCVRHGPVTRTQHEWRVKGDFSVTESGSVYFAFLCIFLHTRYWHIENISTSPRYRGGEVLWWPCLSVCVCLSVREHISGTSRQHQRSPIFVRITNGRGSVFGPALACGSIMFLVSRWNKTPPWFLDRVASTSQNAACCYRLSSVVCGSVSRSRRLRVCLSVGWLVGWLQKRLNRSRCRLSCKPSWATAPQIMGIGTPRKGTFEGEIVGHARTWPAVYILKATRGGRRQNAVIRPARHHYCGHLFDVWPWFLYGRNEATAGA